MNRNDDMDDQDNGEKQLPEIPRKAQISHHGFAALRRVSLNLWLWELLGLLSSIACVGAILVILGKYDGKPVPNWSYGLTVNGVVSVLAVVAKASMILPTAEAISQLKWHWYWTKKRPVLDFERFDSASRGPWGSLMLLFNPSVWSLATIGAALTLAAIALEPSLQQLPTYPISAITSPGEAKTFRSTHWDEVERDGNGYGTVSSKLRGAVYAPIFNSTPSTSQSLAPSCPSGNCTWPIFQSNGVCNTCQNITSKLNVHMMGNSRMWNLSNGLDIIGSTIHNDVAWMIGSYGDSVVYNQSWASQSILDFSYMYVPPVSYIHGFNDTEANAFECVLYHCVKTVQASMQAGSYEETILRTWPEINVTQTGYAEEGNYILRPPGMTGSFSIENTTFALFHRYVSFMVRPSYSSGYNQGAMDPVFNDVPQAFYSSQFINGSIGSNKTKVWEMSGPDKIMDTIALSLTNHMRGLSGKNEAVAGTVVSMQSIVHVRWWWASFAIVLLSLTAGFLLSTMIWTMKKRVPIWKSSSLATLLHGLDDDSSMMMTAHRYDQVEENARAFDMSLRLDGKLWNMIGVRS